MAWVVVLILSGLFTLLMSGLVLLTVRSEQRAVMAPEDLAFQMVAVEKQIADLTELIIKQELRLEALAGMQQTRRVESLWRTPDPMQES